MSEIPVIDVARLADGTDVLNIAKQIHLACLEYGFFQVVNSGISTDLMAKVLGITSQFFDLPLGIKLKIEKPRGKFRGYVQFSDESTNGKADWREGIYYFSDFKSCDAASRAEAELSGKNPWPDADLPEFRSTVAEYFEKATSLGYELMSAVAIGLGKLFSCEDIGGGAGFSEI